MRSSHKMGLMVVVGMLVLGAFAASSASAATPSWKIEGKELKAGEKAALVENITASTHISFGRAFGWQVECTTVKARNANLEGPNLYSAERLAFGGCAFTAPLSDKEHCSIEGGEFITNPVSGTLSTVGSATRLTITPTNKIEFTELHIIGSQCVQSGKRVLKGTMGSEIMSPSLEQTSHLLNFSSTSGSELRLGSELLTLNGKEEFALTSGKKWAA
jgi:hypothetical protein